MMSPCARALVLAAIALLAPACPKGGSRTQTPPAPTSPRVLLFVAYNRVWWAEYKVACEALRAAGYAVDVCSSGAGFATSYQTDGDVQTSADGLAGSSYAAFAASYAATFSATWDAAWNAPAQIPIAGRIQDVASLADYRGLAIVGGVGALDYRYDGVYADTVDGAHVGVAADVQAAAEKLHQLVSEAIQAGKPVLAECHAATLPLFARVPGTAGQMPAPDGLGRSVLEGRSATGYPLGDGDTSAVCGSFAVSYLQNRPLVVDGVVTSRDWYPQTVLHAAATMTSMMATYPTPAQRAAPASVLILHGGPVDPSNPANDIPANYGMSPASVIPVDYLDLQALLGADSPQDDYAFVVTELNLLGGALPFSLNDAAAIEAYFSAFDVVLVFKHWSSSFSDALQIALRSYADAGGGVVALHHALYNHVAGSSNKNILCRDMFGAESASAGWSARNPDSGPYLLMSTGTGHFVSTCGVIYGAAATMPPAGFPASPAPANPSASGYPSFAITDELYNNTAFAGTPVFGDGINQIRPLFANNYTAFPGQVHTAGFTKRFDWNGDGTAGRLVYLEPGERVENFVIGSPYAQIVRNALVWAAQRD